jgi:hypothetical protein
MKMAQPASRAPMQASKPMPMAKVASPKSGSTATPVKPRGGVMATTMANKKPAQPSVKLAAPKSSVIARVAGSQRSSSGFM